jgi:hypothetical protein
MINIKNMSVDMLQGVLQLVPNKKVQEYTALARPIYDSLLSKNGGNPMNALASYAKSNNVSSDKLKEVVSKLDNPLIKMMAKKNGINIDELVNMAGNAIDKGEGDDTPKHSEKKRGKTRRERY